MEESFVDADGIEVGYHVWPASGDPKGSVVIAHGAAEHGGRYTRFAVELSAAGFAVWAPDHRGHGLTGAATGPGRLGPNGFEGVLADLQHVVELAAVNPTTILFGHSMGSVIALRYAQTRHDIDALVLSGPLGAVPGVDDTIAQVEGAVAAGMADTPLESLGPFNDPFEPARTRYDWLSRDESEVDAYIADPLCGDDNPLTYAYLQAILAGVRDGAAHVADLPSDLPVLIVAGERDPVSAFTEQTRRLAELMRASGSTVDEHYYPDARHELLNEINRDEVVADLVAWIGKRADAPS